MSSTSYWIWTDDRRFVDGDAGGALDMLPDCIIGTRDNTGAGDGLPSERRQAITWSNDGIWLVGC